MISFPLRSPQSTEFLVLYNRFSLVIYLIHLHAQSHLILCDSMDCSLPGSFVHGILQARILAAAKSLRSCPTLCDPIDGSPPGSLVPEILQARTLEWVAISFSNAWKWKVKMKLLTRAWLLATPWTAVHQAPPSMGFSRQEYWSGLLLPSPTQTHTYTNGRFYFWPP